MRVDPRVNVFRKRMMQVLTRGINSKTKKRIESGAEIEKIFISRPNGRLGNMLLVTPFIQEIERLFPGSKIDLFVKGGVANVIFKNYDNIDRIISLPKRPYDELAKYLNVWFRLRDRKYDLSINISGSSSSGRLSTKFSRSDMKFFDDEQVDLNAEYADYHHMAKNSIYNFRKFLKETGFDFKEGPIPFMDIKLDETEKEKGRKILYEIFDNDKKTLSIYTFATGSKCYSKEWWSDFYRKLKNQYGEEYNILEVLPIENVSSIGFTAASLYSKDVREMAAVIGLCSVFITADCGIMHLASAAGTPTVGLFSVTDIETYRPYNPSSIALDTNTTTTEEILNSVDHILND